MFLTLSFEVEVHNLKSRAAFLYGLSLYANVNENEDEYEFCPRVVWHFVFVLVVVLTYRIYSIKRSPQINP